MVPSSPISGKSPSPDTVGAGQMSGQSSLRSLVISYMYWVHQSDTNVLLPTESMEAPRVEAESRVDCPKSQTTLRAWVWKSVRETPTPIPTEQNKKAFRPWFLFQGGLSFFGDCPSFNASFAPRWQEQFQSVLRADLESSSKSLASTDFFAASHSSEGCCIESLFCMEKYDLHGSHKTNLTLSELVDAGTEQDTSEQDGHLVAWNKIVWKVQLLLSEITTQPCSYAACVCHKW